MSRVTNEQPDPAGEGAGSCDDEFSSGHPDRPEPAAATAGGHSHDHGLAGPEVPAANSTTGVDPGAASAVRTATARHRKRLILVLAITLTVFFVQLIGAFISGSLSLLADAGHMLTDGTGVAIALIASLIAGLPATSRRTFGYLRVEVLAALVNGIVLGVIAVVIFVQAIARLGTEVEVHSGPMLIAAVIGGTANLVSLLILRGGQKESLNVRGAYLEVLGDLLGSLAVIVAGIVIWLTDWMMVDQIASILIACMIAPRAYFLLRDVVDVLLEASPKNIDIEVARKHMLSVPGVAEVHDVHAWTITSGVPAFSAHVTVGEAAWSERGYHAILDELRACLHEHFDTEHVTLQLEPESHRVTGAHVHP